MWIPPCIESIVYEQIVQPRDGNAVWLRREGVVVSHRSYKWSQKYCNPCSNPEVLNVKYMREISRLIDKYRI